MRVSLILVLLVAFHLPCFGRVRLIPDIPTPSLSLNEAVTIARKRLTEDAKCLLVGAQWCLPADFKLPVSDGTQMLIGGDGKSYSWLITYVIYDEMDAKRLGDKHPEFRDAKYNRVIVIQVKQNGTAKIVPGDNT